MDIPIPFPIEQSCTSYPFRFKGFCSFSFKLVLIRWMTSAFLIFSSVSMSSMWAFKPAQFNYITFIHSLHCDSHGDGFLFSDIFSSRLFSSSAVGEVLIFDWLNFSTMKTWLICWTRLNITCAWASSNIDSVSSATVFGDSTVWPCILCEVMANASLMDCWKSLRLSENLH